MRINDRKVRTIGDMNNEWISWISNQVSRYKPARDA